MHILDNPRWRIPRAFQVECLKNQARYEIAAKSFISYFKALSNEPRIFSCITIKMKVFAFTIPLHDGILPFHLPFSHVNFFECLGSRT